MDCEKCGKKVYSNDPKVEIEKKAYHKSCFKCAEINCKVLLTVQNYVTSNGVLYCSKHAPKLKPVTGELLSHAKDPVASARAEELRKEAIDFSALKVQLKKSDSRSTENLTLPTQSSRTEHEVVESTENVSVEEVTETTDNNNKEESQAITTEELATAII